MSNSVKILLSGVLLLFSACAKAPMNGELDGQWQLLRFETTDGNVQACNRLYFSFQLQVVEVADKGGDGYGTYIGRFTYDEELAEVCIYELRPRSNEGRLATLNELAPFGLFSAESLFKITGMGDGSMVMASDSAVLYFRKF